MSADGMDIFTSHSKLAISLVDQKMYMMAQLCCSSRRQQNGNEIFVKMEHFGTGYFSAKWLDWKRWRLPPKVVCLFWKISV